MLKDLGFNLDQVRDIMRAEVGADQLRNMLAICVRVGLPEDAHLTTAKIGRFVETSGLRLAGASREVFLRIPDPERMHEAVVEMQFPVAN